MVNAIPTIDYTSRDYAALRQSMLNAATDPNSPLYIPGWDATNEGDFGVLLVELFAYMGDIMSYYADRIANEAFLPTATLRSSVIQHAQLLGYNPHGPLAAKTTLQFTFTAGSGTRTIPKGTQVTSPYVPGLDAPVIFETDDDLTVSLSGSGTTTGTVGATQGQTVSNETLGTSDGTPDQFFTLAVSSVIDASWTVQVGTVDPVTQQTVWTTYAYYPRLADAGPTSPAYTVFYNDRGAAFILFGDNVNGQIPPNGASIRATYRVGGGTIGNIGAGQLTSIVSGSAQVGVVSVTNTVVAAGGADIESTEIIRTNAPMAFSTQQRAVTLADFVGLAQQQPGVVRANAVSSSPTGVNVYIVPSSGGQPSSALIAEVQAALQSKSLAGVSVSTLPPTYVTVDITLSIGVLSNFTQNDVKSAVISALQRYFDYSTTTFGETIRIGDLYAVVLGVPGTQWANITVMQRTGGGGGTADIVLAVNEFPAPGTFTLTATGGL